jgi:hypothetical protein
MANFARIDKKNIVQSIHVVDNENLLNEHGIEEEDFGIVYLNKIHGVGFTWIQSSLDGSFRKNCAAIGCTYDKVRDAFIPITPYDSWVSLNEDTCQWEAPVTKLDDSKDYEWDETTTTWNERIMGTEEWT